MKRISSKKAKEHLSAKELVDLAQKTLDHEAKAGQQSMEQRTVRVCNIDSLDHPKNGLKLKREGNESSNVSQLSFSKKRSTPPG